MGEAALGADEGRGPEVGVVSAVCCRLSGRREVITYKLYCMSVWCTFTDSTHKSRWVFCGINFILGTLQHAPAIARRRPPLANSRLFSRGYPSLTARRSRLRVGHTRTVTITCARHNRVTIKPLTRLDATFFHNHHDSRRLQSSPHTERLGVLPRELVKPEHSNMTGNSPS